MAYILVMSPIFCISFMILFLIFLSPQCGLGIFLWLVVHPELGIQASVTARVCLAIVSSAVKSVL